jgi:hypothetical protein
MWQPVTQAAGDTAVGVVCDQAPYCVLYNAHATFAAAAEAAVAVERTRLPEQVGCCSRAHRSISQVSLAAVCLCAVRGSSVLCTHPRLQRLCARQAHPWVAHLAHQLNVGWCLVSRFCRCTA